MRYPDQTPRWRRYLRLAGPNVRRDVDEELRFHFDTRIEELVSGGMNPDEARTQVIREFGDIDDVRSDLVSIGQRVVAKRGRTEQWREALSDVRYAIRSLSRSPGVALAIIATLALGVGANAAMFTFLDAVFLRMPAGVAAPSGLRRLWTEGHFRKGAEFWAGYSYPQYAAVRAAVAPDAEVALYTQPWKTKIGAGETNAQAQVSHASADFFRLTGARAELGRLYGSDEDGLDSPAPVVVVSHRYWKNALNADRNAIGSKLVMGSTTFTIIGVAKEPFVGVDLDATDIWAPLAFEAAGRRGPDTWYKSPNINAFQLLLRPSARANDAQLEQRATVALRRPTFDWLNDSLAVARFGSIIKANGPGKKTQEVQIAVRLVGVSMVVLLIACANVVNLMLARSVRRRREIAVRLALGVTRARLMRLLLSESAILGLGSAAAALGLSYVGGSVLRKLLLPDIHWTSSPIDWRVTLAGLGLALAAGLLAGLVPALQSASTDVTHALKCAGAAVGAQRSRLRAALVVAQAALSVVLLAGAALFVRSLANVRSLDIGFDAARVMSASVSYDDRSTRGDPTFASRLEQTAQRVASLPGVARAALASEPPMYGLSWITFFTATDSGRRDFMPTFAAVTPGYFEAAGLRVLRGRDFPHAAAGAMSPVVIVNEAMAKKAWPSQDAIGQCMWFGSRASTCYRVAGVVENGRERNVIEPEAALKYYLPVANLPEKAKGWTAGYIIINADAARAPAVAASVRVLLRQAFPGGIPKVTRLSDYLEPEYRPWRLGATLFTAFGVLALLVAVVGIYSTVSYGVNQRTHEFGVRIALGAKLGDVVRLVVGQGMRAVAGGVFLGILLAIGAGRFVASLLYGVAPTDAQTYAIVTVLLLATGAAAALMPAWRAARVDPVNALRSD